MNPVHSIQAFGMFGRRPDILLAVAVAAIVSMIVVPLPTIVLDGLIALNLCFAIILLMAVLFSRHSLDLSSFPSLLLLTTLFRLGLNVSTTRGILSKGDAGEIVQAFGRFVVQGDIVVGGVIFLVITLVQFIVIAKGAERVAEVSARFTLDALPGKQLSIDAALRAGAITEGEAQVQRDQLSRESQMFGNMDGAMKFVKGDAIAGLAITVLNLAAGLVIGVLRFDMSLREGLELYTLLTIGDGLVSQTAALVITLSAGMLVTRVNGKTAEGRVEDGNLGFHLKREVLRSTTALWVAASLLIVLALIPGLPALPFLAVAALVVSVNLAKSFLPSMTQVEVEELQQRIDRKIAQAKAQKTSSDELAPSVVPICLALAPDLSDALGFVDATVDPAQTELLGTLVPQLREALFHDSGVRFPSVFLRAQASELPSGTFMIRIDDVPILKERVPLDRSIAITPPAQLRKLGIEAEEGSNPFTEMPASLICRQHERVVEAAGFQVWNTAGIVALHLAAVLRPRAWQFLGLQEVSDLVDRMEKVYPALVREVVPKAVSIGQLLGVLRRLVQEGVSIRNTKVIFEALGEHGPREQDAASLCEAVRASLGSQLAHSFVGLGDRLPVILLDPAIEDTVESAIGRDDYVQYLNLDPDVSRGIIQAIRQATRPVIAVGARPIILTRGRIRRLVRKLIETDLAQVAVLSYDELPPQLIVTPLATATVTD